MAVPRGLRQFSPIKDLPKSGTVKTITLAWTALSFAAVKGIVHAPSARPELKPESRDALVCTENLNPNIVVMKPAKNCMRLDVPDPLNGTT